MCDRQAQVASGKVDGGGRPAGGEARQRSKPADAPARADGRKGPLAAHVLQARAGALCQTRSSVHSTFAGKKAENASIRRGHQSSDDDTGRGSHRRSEDRHGRRVVVRVMTERRPGRRSRTMLKYSNNRGSQSRQSRTYKSLEVLKPRAKGGARQDRAEGKRTLESTYDPCAGTADRMGDVRGFTRFDLKAGRLRCRLRRPPLSSPLHLPLRLPLPSPLPPPLPPPLSPRPHPPSRAGPAPGGSLGPAVQCKWGQPANDAFRDKEGNVCAPL